MSEPVLLLCCYTKVSTIDFMIKTLDLHKTLDYKYVTDLSDYKTIGVVLESRRVFRTLYIY